MYAYVIVQTFCFSETALCLSLKTCRFTKLQLLGALTLSIRYKPCCRLKSLKTLKNQKLQLLINLFICLFIKTKFWGRKRRRSSINQKFYYSTLFRIRTIFSTYYKYHYSILKDNLRFVFPVIRLNPMWSTTFGRFSWIPNRLARRHTCPPDYLIQWHGTWCARAQDGLIRAASVRQVCLILRFSGALCRSPPSYCTLRDDCCLPASYALLPNLRSYTGTFFDTSGVLLPIDSFQKAWYLRICMCDRRKTV